MDKPIINIFWLLYEPRSNNFMPIFIYTSYFIVESKNNVEVKYFHLYKLHFDPYFAINSKYCIIIKCFNSMLYITLCICIQ